MTNDIAIAINNNKASNIASIMDNIYKIPGD